MSSPFSFGAIMKKLFVGFLLCGLMLPSFVFAAGTCTEAMSGSIARSYVDAEYPSIGSFWKTEAGNVIRINTSGSISTAGCTSATSGTDERNFPFAANPWYFQFLGGSFSCSTTNPYERRRYYSGEVTQYSTCPDEDQDDDGVLDPYDVCSDTPVGASVDSDGCELEPATCYDGDVSGDETGLDCGGSCNATCELRCPDGWPPVGPDTWFPEGMCIGGFFPANALGVCPPDTVHNDSENGCVGVEPPVQISSSYTTSEVVALGIEPIDYSYTGDTNVFTQDTTVSVVDNGDGTSTETTVSTAASGEDTSATSETTTRTDIIDNTSSQIISSSIVTVVNEAADDSLSTWGLEGGFPVGEYDSDISEDIPDKKSLTDAGSFLDDFILTSPFFSVLDTASITTANTVCSIDTDLVFAGNAMTIPFDLCEWEDHLIQFGVLLLLVSQFYSLLIVYRGWKL